ncbi:MAG: terpene cyclase/mutase family protein [Candidatus Omnitrophica bacterium]|nr:terpene cyclase/mutase family protein [Candidatus Omnitrophota bacterium]
MRSSNRRQFIKQAVFLAGNLHFVLNSQAINTAAILEGVQSFIHRIAQKDGSFTPGIDPDYKGMSDTNLSGIAAPTYATVLCRTFGWPLPYPDETRDFFHRCQKPDGAFYPPTGAMDPNSPQAKFYNTAQSVVSLKLMGDKPKYDPSPVAEFFFKKEELEKLPLYMTSFFPYFYTALGIPLPDKIDQALRAIIERKQSEDGYVGDHVASTFHAAHYYRLIGLPTPKGEAMLERVLRDQKPDGSWHLFEPDWDVHAAFDALFILRQLGKTGDSRIRDSYQRANGWILKCRKADGGFSHFPINTESDMDAVYFQTGSLVQTGLLQTSNKLQHEEILGWGHAMIPGKTYSCLAS